VLFAGPGIILLFLPCKPCLNQAAPACDGKKGKTRKEDEEESSIQKTGLTYFTLFCETQGGLPQRKRREKKRLHLFASI